MDHPSEDILRRLTAGTGSREENRGVVAHLLKGCPACAGTLRSLMEPAPVVRASYEVPLDHFDQGLLEKIESTIDPLDTLGEVPRGVLDPPENDGPHKKR
jgi:hypothetical protein